MSLVLDRVRANAEVGVAVPIQVVTSKGEHWFADFAKARQAFPTLDLYKNTKDFTWAMLDGPEGNKHLRFEDWATERACSI